MSDVQKLMVTTPLFLLTDSAITETYKSTEKRISPPFEHYVEKNRSPDASDEDSAWTLQQLTYQLAEFSRGPQCLTQLLPLLA